jgi:hypothetical protein
MLRSSIRRLRLLFAPNGRLNCRRRERRAAVCRPRLEILENRTLPSTVTWINPAGGDWDTAANWLDGADGTNHVPRSQDDAVIDTSGITVTHAALNADSVHSLTSAATLVVSDGGLSIAADSVIDSLTQTGGTLTGPGNLTINNAFSWTGGTMSGPGQTVLDGVASMGGGVFGPILDGRTLDNAGTAFVPDGQVLRFDHNALWNNEAGATFTLQGSAALGNFFGQSGRLSNAGLLARSGSASSTSTANIPIENTGTVDVQTGTLTLLVLTNAGELDVEAGAATNLVDGTSNGPINLADGSTLAIGTGFNTGTFTLQDGATVSGQGTVIVAGDSFGQGFLNVTGNATIDNLTISSGVVSVAAGASLEMQNLILAGGRLSGPGTVTVDATLTWTGGTVTGAGQLVLGGKATMGGGTFGPILDNATLDNAGSATVPDGQVLRFDHNARWNNEADATLTLEGSGGLGNFFGNFGLLSNAGLLTRSGADNSTSTIDLGLDNTGTVDVETGTLNLAQTLTNEGEFDLRTGAVIGLAGGNTSGTFNLGPGSVVNVNVDFTERPGANVNLSDGSTLKIGAGFSNATYFMFGDAAVTGTGTVLLGSFFGNGNISVVGAAHIDNLSMVGGTVTVTLNCSLDMQTLNMTGGTLTGPGTATVDSTLTWTGGTMSGQGHTVVNGDATVGHGPFDPVLDTRTLDNAGNATVPAGAVLLFANNALWNNEAGATLTLQASAALGNFFGQSGQLSNAGQLFTPGAGSGTGQAVINFAVTNSGTIDLAGILIINGNYTQTPDGTLNLHLGGTTVGSQYDQLQVHGLAMLDGTLNITLVGGFSPAVGDSFRILTFNSRSGDFAAINLPDPGAGLFLDPVYDSSGLTLRARAT